ncbi:hypothetical protein F5144DRAFT_185095 [Chaetomium tenue]|uniref:Uncharacterized protein n=1 Tax=Chaetomium tenue TaxID=1854479 RepID=A0ACB7PFY3_9PEZI|nr:hypothetical protein F5144DRAFT_185095 [Chaetomium globosum]
MDAQNAAEPAPTKPAASPKRPGSDSDHPKPAAVTKLSSVAKPELPHRENRPSASCARPSDDDGAADGNSDAETIVLPGKDGHSPSKVRKIIKHEKSDTDEALPSLANRKHSLMKQERDSDKGDQGDRPPKPDRPTLVTGAGSNEGTTPSILGKKKKHLDKPKVKDGSSGLSSAPGSPPQPQRRRRLSNAHSRSDSETAPVDSTKTSTKDKSKPLEKVLSHKRKAPRPDSEDEAESRKIRRQRTSGSGLDASRKHTLPLHHPTPSQKSHAADAPPSIRTRSISPHPRAHRRSASTQLLSHSNGLSQKKKRVPAPLQSTDYHSDDSSASGSPHPRSSKLRGLATPATADSTVSPAKMAPHKKHLDAHGQTFLARACAKGEYDTAKLRLQDRPDDINVADYAGNTPLQIAALNGYDDIVKLLVDAGCNLDCVNNDKDTPLIDAVENGHLDVVKILLDAGVNPRKANAYGQEPIDRVNDELEFADEIRGALNDAKQKMGERRRTSEEHHTDMADTRSSYGPDSPRRSPGAPNSIHAGAGRRAGTVRATKTSNHLLYMPMDDKTLRSAAARGDEETVTRILQVRENFDDPESMVAAARGGHDIVMQLLLALGKANPDPSPIPSPNSEHSTPMLAAIGQENIKVVRLLLDQTDFDPTRRIKGEAYHEIARRRRGPNWMEEEHMLKDAYDEHRKSHKEILKNRSPSRREQVDREPRRRLESRDESAKPFKRKAISPAMETEKHSTSPKEKRRASSFTAHQDDQTSPKRGPGRPKKDDRIPTIAIPDREQSPAGKPVAKVKRAESDLAAVSSEGETTKPRRKLVSGRELKGERERQRRPSLASIASSMKEPSSPREEPDKAQMTEKYHDRTKALKRDESRDRLSVSADSTGKRHRSSATPPHPGHSDKDGSEAPIKRRRLDAEGKEKRPKSSQSDDRLLKASVPRDATSSSAAGPRPPSKTRDEEDRRPTLKAKKAEALLHHGRRESGKSISSEGSIHVKSEDPDVEMPDAAPSVTDTSEPKHSLQKDKREEEQRKQSELEARSRETKRKEEEKRRRDGMLAAVQARKREEDDQRRKEEEDRERERKRKQEEEQRRLEEEERKQLEEEQQRVHREQKRKLEEAERRRREEEERKQKEEEERKKREEEERLRREQLEREAAEEARRQREEEEKKEQERKERAFREEAERRRAAREAERAAKEADERRIHLEQERARLAKLPPVLRWLDSVANPKLAQFAEKFAIMQGVRYDCINPEANGTSEGREQWLLNTQVALLLGEKDLELSRYTGWARKPVSLLAKRALWRLESDRYALTTPALFDLGTQLPGYYQEKDPRHMAYPVLEILRAEAWEKFVAMEMFFVKTADFLYIIPTIQHLRNVKLTLTYCELPENEQQSIIWTPRQKWKHDPDPDPEGPRGFAPSNKHYVNGELVSEGRSNLRKASTSPFPRQRIARRGLVAVLRENQAFTRVTEEQRSYDEPMVDVESSVLPNGVHTSPTAARVQQQNNGITRTQ